MSRLGADGWALVGDWNRSKIPSLEGWQIMATIEVITRDPPWLDSAVACYLHDHPTAILTDVLDHVRAPRPAWVTMYEDGGRDLDHATQGKMKA